MKEKKPASKNKLRKKLFGCCSGCVVIIVLLAFVLLGFFLFQLDSYNSWRQSNEEMLTDFERESLEAIEADKELEESLDRFHENQVERETLTITCDQLRQLTGRTIRSNWEERSVKNLGIVCGERKLDIYIKTDSNIWFVVNLWQRAEGEMDFVVYDIKLGPFSLGKYSFGYVTAEVNKGIEDAVSFLKRSDLLGREIVEIYLEPGEIRIVGEK
jgi:hypothetical protein